MTLAPLQRSGSDLATQTCFYYAGHEEGRSPLLLLNNQGIGYSELQEQNPSHFLPESCQPNKEDPSCGKVTSN